MNNPVSQPTPPSGNESPVVTEGRAGTGGPYEDFFSAYRRLQELNKPAPPAPGPMGITPSQQRSLDQLGAFGAALASTRSPNFMGAFGEGLRAVQQTEASQRGEARQEQQDERQRQQASMEAAYRATQEARQAAEFRYAQDPTNPRNQLLVAQARAAEIEARARLMQASTAAQSERLGQGVQTRDEATGRFQMEFPMARGGNQVRPLSGVPLAATSTLRRAEQADQDAIRQAMAAGARGYRDSIRASGQLQSPAEIETGAAEVARRAAIAEATRRGVDPAIIERMGPSETPARPDVRVRPF